MCLKRFLGSRMKTYEIIETADGKAIKCLTCGLTSYHPEDVRRKYCGHCHKFHAAD